MTTKHHKPAFLKISTAELNYSQFAKEYEQAIYALGLLEGSQKNLQNPDLLISPLSAKEAAVSSKIEGTVSTVSDVFLYEAGGKPLESDTVQVVNYRRAMRHAIDELKEGRKITSHLIESLHATLLRGVGHKGNYGKYRENSVWVAEKRTDPIEKAIYVPPESHLVRDYMENLIDYIENGQEGSLIKAGLFHYQFEAVHPFDDGNGRLGRLLIPLILFNEKKISSPILYLSGYFEAHRDEYLSVLHEVDKTGKYERWLAFFLRSVAEQLKVTQKLIEDIYNLYNDIRTLFEVTKSPYLIPFVDFIFEFPSFTLPQAQKKLQSNSRLTVDRLIRLFEEKGIIQDLNIRAGRSKIYLFKPLLDLLR
ncbi:MAG: Fic family protein [Nitrospinae bacterium]|jgi:Fic family protein|nr:Fic family protein [Nitrospinota bacterium]MDA1110446.1 Fic family protein [Nitrospinota bacterium]